MFMSAPNPADVVTTAVAACLVTRMPPDIAWQAQISQPPEPRTTVWLPLRTDTEPPHEGAVLVLNELADEVTLDGSMLYTLAADNVVSPGIPPSSTTAVDRVVRCGFVPDARPPPEPSTPTAGRLVCVTTDAQPVFSGELMWLEVAVAGVVRTSLVIEGPIGTVDVRHGARWKKIVDSGSVTTALLCPL